MIFLAYLVRHMDKQSGAIVQIERRLEAAPYVPKALAAKGKVLIPPPPPYAVPEN
jgi:hypothetical protein